MSTLLADTIRKTGGTAGVDIRLKNNSVCESEGGTSVTTSISQGLAKSWNTVISQASTNSLNVSSTVDVAAGVTEDNFANNFTAANYASPAVVGGVSDVKTFVATSWYNSSMYTTGLSRTGTYLDTSSAYTDSNVFIARFGDLA